MRFVDSPTRNAPWEERPGDDLDGLLTAFFRSELPSRWPDAPQTEVATLPLRPALPRRKSAWNSRYALAASVALLMVAGWLLSGKFQDLGTGPGNPVDEESLKATTEDGRPVKMKISLPLKSGKVGVQIDVHEDPAEDMGGDLRKDLGLPPE